MQLYILSRTKAATSQAGNILHARFVNGTRWTEVTSVKSGHGLGKSWKTKGELSVLN